MQLRISQILSFPGWLTATLETFQAQKHWNCKLGASSQAFCMFNDGIVRILESLKLLTGFSQDDGRSSNPHCCHQNDAL